MHSITITTRLANQSYVTNRVQGQSAASTSAAQFAARRLAEKLFGPYLLSVAWLRLEEGSTVEHWQVSAQGEPKAWCWRTGEIDVGVHKPEDAIQFAFGAYQPLVDALEVVGRHGKGKFAEKLLVPGIPEAGSQEAAFQALMKFVAWCATPPDRFKGVTFSTQKLSSASLTATEPAAKAPAPAPLPAATRGAHRSTKRA